MGKGLLEVVLREGGGAKLFSRKKKASAWRECPGGGAWTGTGRGLRYSGRGLTDGWVPICVSEKKWAWLEQKKKTVVVMVVARSG